MIGTSRIVSITTWSVACALLTAGSGCQESDITLGKRADGAVADARTQGVDQAGCPAVMPCNWCGGTAETDSQGCVTGFRCANGEDPCSTEPCSQTPPTGCQAGETCGSDKLCWPESDAGVPQPDQFSCPPMPACNWCGGSDIYDEKGCVIGYGPCANGADPCSTVPCLQTPPTGCQPGETCGTDQLCWPESDAGVPPDAGPPQDSGTICPPVMPCNWCSGEASLDHQGCVTGWTCANGANPCVTDPCTQTPPTGCQPGEICGSDMLCWGEPSQPFACGALATCQAGQYCQQTISGTCGGTPLAPGGSCAPNCSATTCPGSTDLVCMCDDFDCEPLPQGCSGCACLQSALPGCSCTDLGDGELQVVCAMP